MLTRNCRQFDIDNLFSLTIDIFVIGHAYVLTQYLLKGKHCRQFTDEKYQENMAALNIRIPKKIPALPDHKQRSKKH
jgi:hypothetical protein